MKGMAALTVLSVALGLMTQNVYAQTYPVKPIRLIVPLAPGGPSDILARTVAAKLTEGIGQSVIVENRAGAGGSVGADYVAKSAPDGYTIILVSNSVSINPSLYPKLPYDTLRDLAPITTLASAPYILTVHPTLPVKSTKELIALARSRPGELNYASGGSGTGPHMAMELLKQLTGTKLVHIPYKGAGPALIDTMAGQTQVLMVNIIAGLPQVKGGRIHAIDVSSAKRASVAPEIPPIAEAVPGFDEGGQHGILAPGNTPREIIARLNTEIVKALNSPEIKSRLAGEGAEVVGNTPEQFGAILKSDVEKWAKLIKASGIKVD
ncbi:MAG TPA: tripartite tricarboxylate transporter substrate binding protein [Burkholderiales bacterium]|nr:tripartite tricarboxylate transporter substrate binding protein [Burkholderiales bacterium]